MASVDAYMRRALELARRGEGHTRPNPPVGAVIVKRGRIIGEGWHRRCGGKHAETSAIADCRESPKGATIYVTLEPCSKPGRVGACTDAIVASGISKVVYAVADPNPKNRGKAKKVLAKSGVRCEKFRSSDVELMTGLADLIAPFSKHVLTGLPYVTVKIALSLDGKICDDWGNAKWISSASARRLTGKMRERVDAIMVGAETVRRDNPSLLSHGRRNDDLIRVVVSRSGKLPPDAQVLADCKNPTLVFPDAEMALRKLGREGVMHVLCEGGLKLATSLAEAGLVDEWIAVVSPKVIGSRPIGDAIEIGKMTCLPG